MRSHSKPALRLDEGVGRSVEVRGCSPWSSPSLVDGRRVWSRRSLRTERPGARWRWIWNCCLRMLRVWLLLVVLARRRPKPIPLAQRRQPRDKRVRPRRRHFAAMRQQKGRQTARQRFRVGPDKTNIVVVVVLVHEETALLQYLLYK